MCSCFCARAFTLNSPVRIGLSDQDTQSSGWKRHSGCRTRRSKNKRLAVSWRHVGEEQRCARCQCVERKQLPLQDAPAAHMLNPKPLFLFPFEHPEPSSCLLCRSFDDSERRQHPKSAYDSFMMSHPRNISQIQTVIRASRMWLGDTGRNRHMTPVYPD